ncbi:hypothetical protein D3C80_1593780 [compost metagenome]
MLVSSPMGKNSVVTMTKQATVSEKIASHGDDAGLSLLFNIVALISGEYARRTTAVRVIGITIYAVMSGE